MHPAALEFISRYRSDGAVRVLDVGGRNINGSAREFFPNAEAYVVVDLVEHDSVDHVGDILDMTVDDLGGTFDVAIYAEVAEHTPDWTAHLSHIFDLLGDSGVAVVTAAGPDRTPHSAVDGGLLRDDEWYENLTADGLCATLYQLTDWYLIDEHGDDVRAMYGKG